MKPDYTKNLEKSCSFLEERLQDELERNRKLIQFHERIFAVIESQYLPSDSELYVLLNSYTQETVEPNVIKRVFNFLKKKITRIVKNKHYLFFIPIILYPILIPYLVYILLVLSTIKEI